MGVKTKNLRFSEKRDNEGLSKSQKVALFPTSCENCGSGYRIYPKNSQRFCKEICQIIHARERGVVIEGKFNKMPQGKAGKIIKRG